MLVSFDFHFLPSQFIFIVFHLFESIFNSFHQTMTTAETVIPFDRWSLVDDSTVPYGYFSKSVPTTVDTPSFYITTAINYTNGPAHMGHAYEAATSDAIARYKRLEGMTTYFVTGADEHGQKIANAAAAVGQEPMEICNQVRRDDFAYDRIRYLMCEKVFVSTMYTH